MKLLTMRTKVKKKKLFISTDISSRILYTVIWKSLAHFAVDIGTLISEQKKNKNKKNRWSGNWIETFNLFTKKIAIHVMSALTYAGGFNAHNSVYITRGSSCRLQWSQTAWCERLSCLSVGGGRTEKFQFHRWALPAPAMTIMVDDESTTITGQFVSAIAYTLWRIKTHRNCFVIYSTKLSQLL